MAKWKVEVEVDGFETAQDVVSAIMKVIAPVEVKMSMIRESED